MTSPIVQVVSCWNLHDSLAPIPCDQTPSAAVVWLPCCVCYKTSREKLRSVALILMMEMWEMKWNLNRLRPVTTFRWWILGPFLMLSIMLGRCTWMIIQWRIPWPGFAVMHVRGLDHCRESAWFDWLQVSILLMVLTCFKYVEIMLFVFSSPSIPMQESLPSGPNWLGERMQSDQSGTSFRFLSTSWSMV